MGAKQEEHTEERRLAAEDAKYWAFISYSHQDVKVATTLQRSLETYRLPRKLVGSVTAEGVVPAVLKPVFRDRDELQAGADLKATVQQALQGSRFLIVVCTPAAAQSSWVDREIVEFKKLHGEAHVLALIADGEPNASRMSGREAEECFPPALRFALTPEGRSEGVALEPIAADLRQHGDGQRLATLKLIAGMVGVGVDELVQRDASRRARRMSLLALAAVAGMAVMSVLTWMAVQARDDAQRQHAQAEGLIEFMVGELRKKLEPVGRLDVLDSVGEKVLTHYAAQDEGRLDATSLGHRSRALHLVGEIRQLRGNLGDAMTAFERAADTTQALLARSPRDEQRIFDHAQSVYWVGTVARERGQIAAAEAAFRSYSDLAHRLVSLNPGKADWRLEVAYSATNLGIVLLDQGRAAQAIQALNEARDMQTALTSKQPELAFDLAHTHGWLSRAYAVLGQYDGAVAEQRTKQKLLAGMPDAAKNRQVQRSLQNALNEMARLELARGQIELAQQNALASSAQALAVVQSDSANLFWLSELCLARIGLASVQLALDRRAEARDLLKLARQDAEHLISIDSTRIDPKVYLRGAVLTLSARASDGDTTALATELGDYIASVKQLSDGGVYMRPAHRLAQAKAQIELGRLLTARGELSPGQAQWRNVVESLSINETSADFDQLTVLARAQSALGETAKAQALVERIQASQYRHPDFADLVKTMSSGKGPKALTSTPRKPS